MIGTRYRVAPPTFDFFTLVFALTYIFGLVMMRIIGQEVTKPFAASRSPVQLLTSLMNLDFALAASILVVGVVAFFYCRSVVVGVREAMASTKETPARVRTAGGDAPRTEQLPFFLRDTAVVVVGLVLLIVLGAILFGLQ